MDRGSELYRLFLEGNKDAFDGIIKEYHSCVINFITGYTKNSHTAEDLAMDTFAELIASPNRFKFKCSLKTYLFTIAKNKAIDYLRKEKNRTAFISCSYNIQPAPFLCSPEDIAVCSQSSESFNRCFSSLPRDYRVALYLIYSEDCSYKEAAKIMNKTEKQITNLVYRGKKALKELLEKEVDSCEKY